ncbi:MAG: hypothetical protein PVH25_11485 [Burkholderiales bacterium]|jgi:hypothetical protein
MILNKSTIAATCAVVVFGALMISPASAASKWSDLSSVTKGADDMIHPTAGGKESFSPTDLSAVTHKDLTGTGKQIGHVSTANYRGTDLTAVTHRHN